MLDSDPPTFAVVASDALLAALQKASEATNLSRDERYEVAVARFITARALWRARRVK
jgi:predicted transcriptional regulator